MAEAERGIEIKENVGHLPANDEKLPPIDPNKELDSIRGAFDYLEIPINENISPQIVYDLATQYFELLKMISMLAEKDLQDDFCQSFPDFMNAVAKAKSTIAKLPKNREEEAQIQAKELASLETLLNDPEARKKSIKAHLEKHDYWGMKDLVDGNSERLEYLAGYIFFMESKFKQNALETVDDSLKEFLRETLENKVEHDAFLESLNHPVERKAAIRAHLETHDYWGVKDLLGKNLERLDYLVDYVYYLESKNEENTLETFNEALQNRLVAQLNYKIEKENFLESLNHPVERKATIKAHLETHDYWGLRDLLGTNLEHLDYLVDYLYSLETKDQKNTLKKLDGNLKKMLVGKLTDQIEKFRFLEILNHPEQRKSIIKEDLETNNYWGLKDLLGANFERLDYFVNKLYEKEVSRGKSVLNLLKEDKESIFINILNQKIEEDLFLTELENPERRKAKIKTYLADNDYLGLSPFLGENLEKTDGLVDFIFSKEKDRRVNYLTLNSDNFGEMMDYLVSSNALEDAEAEVANTQKVVLKKQKSDSGVLLNKKENQEKELTNRKKESTHKEEVLANKEEALEVEKILKIIRSDKKYENNLSEILKLFSTKEWIENGIVQKRLEKWKALSSLALENGTPADQEAVNKISYRNLLLSGINQGFDASLSEIVNSEDVSDDLKTKICEKFGIHKPDTTTGSDVKASLERGFRTDENGERVPYTKEQPLALTENVTVYETKQDSDYVVDVNLGDWRNIKVKVPSNLSGVELGKHIYIAQIIYALEKLGGMSEFIFGRDLNILHESPLEIQQGDFIEAKKAGQYFLNGFSGENGEILKEKHITQLKHSFQWFHKKGDWATDDVTPDVVQGNLKELGILDKSNVLNRKQFEKAGDFIQRNYGTGAPDFETLKAYLKVEDELENSDEDDFSGSPEAYLANQLNQLNELNSLNPLNKPNELNELK